MAMLVRAVCADCGLPVRPKNKAGKVYVHADLGCDHQPTRIAMVTVRERY